MNTMDDSDFAEKSASGVVLIDFFAEWCGPCRMQTPILEALSKELDGQVNIFKLDIDKAQKTTAQFGVTSVPTIIVLKNGAEVERIVGLRDADALKSVLAKHTA